MKPYPKYKDSGVEWIGEVPEGWGILRLKWVCNFLYGESLSAQEREDGTIPVYGSNGIVGYHNRSITENPCIIVGRKGSFGKVTFSEKKCYPIDTTYYIDCTSTKNYMRWLWYLLPLLKMDEFSRDSAVPGLNREDAYRNIVTLPSSYEQKQIATYLDHKTTQIDNLISKKQKLIELLKEERSAIINQAVTKGLNPDAPMKDSGIEWIGEVSYNWEKTKIKFSTKFINGYAFKPDDYVNSKGIPIIRIGDIKPEIDFNKAQKVPEEYAETFKAFTVKKNDILVALTGATIGKSTIYKSVEPALLNQRVGILRPKDKIHLNFLKYFIGSNIFKQLIDYECIGGAQENIGKEEIGSCVLYLPKLQDQIQTSLFLDRKTSKTDQTISKIEKQIELLQEFRTALISEVVTEKIDVRDEESNE